VKQLVSIGKVKAINNGTKNLLNSMHNQLQKISQFVLISSVSVYGLDTGIMIDENHPLNGNSAYDINYNAFTIDFQYRWIFAPGSELSLVWKNSIFIDDINVDRSYFNNLQYSLTNGPLNSFSIKMMYWLDYSQIKKVFTNRKKNS